METERIAIIDVGTNTFHLIIAEIQEGEDFIITNRFKEIVKLGEGGIGAGKIAKPAFERGIKVLKNFRKLINSKGARKTLAFATSAVRSASNGPEFLKAAKSQADMDIRIIHGNEEAALIFEGVKNGIALPYDQDTLLVDIGGGSVEFIVVRENKPLLLRSLDIGAARALENVKPEDPVSKDDLTKAKKFFLSKMSDLLTELKQFDIQLIAGSSGTFETLGAMIALEEGQRVSAENLNSYVFSKSSFQKIHKKLISSSRADRLKIPGMEPQRADMIVMGSVLTDLLFDHLKCKEVIVSVNALKEGILYRYLDEKKERMNFTLGHGGKNLRAKAVRSLAKKFRCDIEHGLKVAEIAVYLFDQLSSLHQMGEQEKELLRFAAMLHDIGYFISPGGHHKHGQYIVSNSGLSGFSSDELTLIGNVIRYHRKSLPSRDHFHFKLLTPHHRLLVRVLAGILRIADNLDRGHRHLVEELMVKVGGSKIEIMVSASDNVEMEIESAKSARELLEQVFSLDIEIREA